MGSELMQPPGRQLTVIRRGSAALTDRPCACNGARRWGKEALYWLYLHAGPRRRRDGIRRRDGHQQIVIVYYHRIGACDHLTRPSESFRQDVDYLSTHFDCLTLHDLCTRLDEGRPLNRPLAVITFDDGYRDNYTLALPILKQAMVPATLFVSTGYIGTQRVFPHDERAVSAGRSLRADWPKLSWDDLRDMQDQGMEIGSHTVEHVSAARVPLPQLEHELSSSLQALNRELGVRPRAFCFPWGTASDIGPDAASAVRRAGYYAAVTTVPGEVSQQSDRFALPRIDLGNGAFTRGAMIARIHGFGRGRLARTLHGQ
jgi:peptidoglycan/xylan/chitin deacetylase (PgdA/CDA1 family)